MNSLDGVGDVAAALLLIEAAGAHQGPAHCHDHENGLCHVVQQMLTITPSVSLWGAWGLCIL